MGIQAFGREMLVASHRTEEKVCMKQTEDTSVAEVAMEGAMMYWVYRTIVVLALCTGDAVGNRVPEDPGSSTFFRSLSID